LPSEIGAQLQDVNHPYGRHFNKFTPPHVLYYPKGIAKALLILVLLNMLANYGAVQSGSVLLVEVLTMGFVVHNPPYALLSQSRSEMVNAIGRMLVYLLSLLAAMGSLGEKSASGAMVQIQFLSLIFTVLTQLYPMIENAVMAVQGILEPLFTALLLIAFSVEQDNEKEAREKEVVLRRIMLVDKRRTKVKFKVNISALGLRLEGLSPNPLPAGGGKVDESCYFSFSQTESAHLEGLNECKRIALKYLLTAGKHLLDHRVKPVRNKATFTAITTTTINAFSMLCIS